jgi:hypothetical protein
MLTPIINYRRPNVSQGIPIGYWYAKGGPASTLDSPLEKWGCTDPKATNYDSRASKDDGSCKYKTTIDADHAPTSAPEPVAIYGCTDPKAKNYDSKANKDDGSCTYYDATLTQQPSEPLTILGCTDPKATNYDSKATKNDGSCKYPDTVIKIDSGGTLTTIKDGEITSAVTTGGGGGYGGGGFGGGMPSEEEMASATTKPKNKLVGLILLAGLAYVGFKLIKR